MSQTWGNVEKVAPWPSTTRGFFQLTLLRLLPLVQTSPSAKVTRVGNQDKLSSLGAVQWDPKLGNLSEFILELEQMKLMLMCPDKGGILASKV